MASKNNKPSPQPKKPTSKQSNKKKNSELGQPKQDRLIIAGIGASAGGLPALQAFFSALPNETGVAYVVVTHLHPEHESHMAELIQSHTQMKVEQVTKRTDIEPNRVYVIPPNKNIIVTDAHLDISDFDEPRGHRTPIDQFFRTLAKQKHHSIAIILSGGGTDGAVGIKDIKEEGGLLMVQHPDQAEYDSMPIAAINTGLADVVLPVEELAQKLADYVQQIPEVPEDAEHLSEQDQETIQRILAQVHARTGHDFSQYKRSTLLRRIQRRMQLNGFGTLDTYLNYLRSNATEAVSMFNDLLIGVTNFFRDNAPWEALAEKAIPALFDGKEPGEPIRAWSIGCATGEEAYSVAILLLEERERRNIHYEIQVFASDLDDYALGRGREGLYPSAIEADVSPERLERFFVPQGNHYQVKRELRDMVLFTNHSVLRDPPFSRIDLIACRNVLIYLQRPVQDNVFDIFHYSLNNRGYLFLGGSESAEAAEELFSAVDKANRIYQAKPWRGETPHVPALPLGMRRAPRTMVRTSLHLPARNYVEDLPALDEKHKQALEEFGPPSILVNEDHNIIHLSETAGRYLLQPKGPITSDLIKVVRPELQMELRSALFQALENDRIIISKPIAVQFNGHPRQVVFSVLPRKSPTHKDNSSGKLALVVFLENEMPETTGNAQITMEEARDQARSSNAMVEQLEEEVRNLREQLQATVEEFESSNEEMKAANEELQSINEEYRSATEELETSKEELQSVNEELQTVNQELKGKLEEISRAHSDLENLMASSEIASLFLDRELHIQRYAPGISDLFNIIGLDRGRPIAHLTHKLNYDELVSDAEKVLRKLIPIEREISGEGNRWFLVRQRPYRTLDDKIDGVVITFVDITEVKQAQESTREMAQNLEDRVSIRTEELNEANKKLTEARDLFQKLFDANPIPTSIARLEDGKFINVNEAYLQYYNLKFQDVVGHTSHELKLPLAPNLREKLIDRVQKEGIIRNMEMETRLPSGELRTIIASIQIVTVEDTDALMLAFSDITERVRAEHQVRTAATSLSAAEQVERQRISQILHDELQQNIFAVKMQLSFLADAIAKGNAEAAHVDLQQLDTWLAEAIATTRQLSVDLSPPVLRGEGLMEALLWIASQMKTQYGLEVKIESNDVQASFDDDVRMVVFQSLRELLFNVVKHSGTLEVLVTLEQLDGRVKVTVSDQGKGFNRKGIDDHSASGLKKMRDRLFLVGANLKVESEPGHGTRVTIEAPTTDLMV
ncbi:MAG TPA: chemotaxis protein CheB [Anaerolineales bacterium]|nr:chemotaxis protein CheB [Anaerolineales bacterium]